MIPPWYLSKGKMKKICMCHLIDFLWLILKWRCNVILNDNFIFCQKKKNVSKYLFGKINSIFFWCEKLKADEDYIQILIPCSSTKTTKASHKSPCWQDYSSVLWDSELKRGKYFLVSTIDFCGCEPILTFSFYIAFRSFATFW